MIPFTSVKVEMEMKEAMMRKVVRTASSKATL